MELDPYTDLLELQAVDLQIDRLLHQRASIPELEELRELAESLQVSQTKQAELAAADRTVGRDLDKAEGELEMVEAKLQEAETRLYAGGMSARETEHKRLEVASLRGQVEALETRVLGLIDVKEARAEGLAVATQEVDRLNRRKLALEELIGKAWAEIDAVLARRQATRSDIAAEIDPDALETYSRLRRSKEGVAIARFEAGQCGGCHLSLSPAEQREAADSDPPRCVHCRRLLVF